MPDDFNWKPENGDVIVPDQRATAVYVNRWGQAVIRQERAWDEEEDIYVVIDHASIPAVIKALRDIADAPATRDREAEPPPASTARATGAGAPAAKASSGVVVLNEHIAEKARGEHSWATE